MYTHWWLKRHIQQVVRLARFATFIVTYCSIYCATMVAGCLTWKLIVNDSKHKVVPAACLANVTEFAKMGYAGT